MQRATQSPKPVPRSIRGYATFVFQEENELHCMPHWRPIEASFTPDREEAIRVGREIASQRPNDDFTIDEFVAPLH